MTAYDNWLLQGSEPEMFDEDSAPYGVCETCESAMDYVDEVGEFCATCQPLTTEESIDVRASFQVTDGVVVRL